MYLMKAPLQNYQSTSGILCFQEAQSIRLQRLTQQRKRMEQMASVILQQNQTIQILKCQNQQVNKNFYEMKVQWDIINERMMLQTEKNYNLRKIVIKNFQVIDRFKNILQQKDDTNEYRNNYLLKEIELIQQDNSLEFFKIDNQNKKLKQLKKIEKQQYSIVMEENQLLKEKYDQLCVDYFELVKKNKFRQLNDREIKTEILKQKKTEKQDGYSNRYKTKNQDIQMKNQRIKQLQKIITNLQAQIKKKDNLIENHRENQIQQTKLLTCLKNQLKIQDKQINQIILSQKTSKINQKSQAFYTQIIKSEENKVVKSKQVKKQSVSSKKQPLQINIQTENFKQQILKNQSLKSHPKKSKMNSKTDLNNQILTPKNHVEFKVKN